MDKIKKYYDENADFYHQIGTNDRNFQIHSLLIKNGLQKNHAVLEIGCGVGVQTILLAKYLDASSEIQAIDISEKCIALAKTTYKKYQNIQWETADYLQYTTFDKKYDVIVLPDVLHYISPNSYGQLFKNLKAHLSHNGFIMIHSPSAAYIEWCRKNDSSKLNIDDNPIDSTLISHACDNNDLCIRTFATYSLWTKDHDFQYWIIRHKQSNTFDTQQLSVRQRLMKKFRFWYYSFI